MTLYFDLDIGRFVTGVGTRDTVADLTLKRGDLLNIPVRFIASQAYVELPDGATGILGVKAQGTHDGDFLAAALSWVKTGAGTSAAYTFALNLNTVALNALLGVGAAADVASVVTMMEMEIQYSGITTSSNTILATIQNDIVRGTEGTPLTSPSAAEWLLGSTAPINDGTATVTLNPAGDNNSILLTADNPGPEANDLTAAIIIDAATDRTQLDASLDGDAISLTSGDKRRMIISGAITAGVNGPLIFAGNLAGSDFWTSNGLTNAANYGVNAFTQIESEPGITSTITRFDAAGTVLYQSSFVGGGPGGAFPDQNAYDPPSTGSGTPAVAASPATAAQGIAVLNIAALGVTASDAPGSDGSGALAAVAATNLSGGGNTPAPPYIRVAGGYLYIQEDGVWKKAALSAL